MFEPGNQLHLKARKAKRVSEALERACLQEDGKRIRAGVEKLLDAFSNGEPWAIQQLWDRTEGKPAQSVTVSGDEDRPLVSLIRVLVVNANDEQRVITHDNSEQPLTLPAVEEKKGEEIIQETPPLPHPLQVIVGDGGTG